MYSFIAEWLELLGDAGTWDSEVAVAALLDEASVDELLDEVGGSIAFITISLQHLDLHLHGIVVD